MKRNAGMRQRWVPVLALGVALIGGTVALAAHVPQVDPSTVPPGPALGSAFLATHNSVDQLRASPFARAIKRHRADVFVQHVRLGANAATGWHTHPGPAIVTVVGGALTYEDACGQATYGPGQGFLDRGFGHVHRAVAGPAGADFYVTYVLPSGSATHVISANQPTQCTQGDDDDDDD
jgi:quercetin dioxygenase-like cupin family protein